jgi:DNA repair ATPase RecN
MKIKELKVKNFAKFTDLQIEFDSQITRLVGVNGSGKSSILLAIFTALKGMASKGDAIWGERFRFMTAGSDPDIQLTLVDEVKGGAEIIVRNELSKKGNEITFRAPDDYPISQEWLSQLLSLSFVSAKNFCQLSGKEQAILLGIETDIYDRSIKGLKDEFTLLGRELKTLGTPEPVEKKEKVSITDLLIQKKVIDDFNIEQDNKQVEFDRWAGMLTKFTAERAELVKELALLDEKISSGQAKLSLIPKPDQKKDIVEITKVIQNSELINLQADAYEKYQTKLQSIETKKEEIKANKEKQVQAEDNKINYIKSFDFGFDGLSVNDDGELLLNDGTSSRPIKEPYFSKGQLEIIVARLYASTNPDLKVRFLDDFNLIDNSNQEKIINELVEAGFQLIVSEVAESSTKENVILLRECRVVSDEELKTKKSLL